MVIVIFIIVVVAVVVVVFVVVVVIINTIIVIVATAVGVVLMMKTLLKMMIQRLESRMAACEETGRTVHTGTQLPAPSALSPLSCCNTQGIRNTKSSSGTVTSTTNPTPQSSSL